MAVVQAHKAEVGGGDDLSALRVKYGCRGVPAPTIELLHALAALRIKHEALVRWCSCKQTMSSPSISSENRKRLALGHAVTLYVARCTDTWGAFPGAAGGQSAFGKSGLLRWCVCTGAPGWKTRAVERTGSMG